MCLLPSRLYPHAVDKVILCGSQLLEEYIKTPFYESYRTKISRVFDSPTPNDNLRIKENLRQVVEENLHDPGFHHVLTEVALLEILRSPASQSHTATTIIPVILNGDEKVFPEATFPPTTVRITVWTPDQRGQHEAFFKILPRIFEGEEFLLKAIEAAYRACLELPRQESNTMYEGHALEMFHQAYHDARRDDLQSSSFAGFLQQHQYSFEKIAEILELLQSQTGRSASEKYLRELDSVEQRMNCHQALFPTGIAYSRQKDQNPKAVDGTCLWTLEHPTYVAWRDTVEKRLLWISADAGCGKSVLCRKILEDDLPKRAPQTRVIYFFFKDTSSDQRSARLCLLALLHQLICTTPSLVEHAMPLYQARKRGIAESSFSELWAIFMAMVRDANAGDIICVLDALDECNEKEREELVSSIQTLCWEEELSSVRLRFLVTSRPYLDLKVTFKGILSTSAGIQLDGTLESDQIKREIDLVIHHHVEQLAEKIRFPVKVRDYLRDTLIEIENRTYLWLRLVFDLLPKRWPMTVPQMKKIISTLPKGIDEAYESLLSKCDDPEYTKKVLQIVLAAYQPMTLDEIDEALNITEDTKKYADLDLEYSSNLQQTLPGRCGLMIVIVDSKVYFIHQTVKEFLLKIGTRPANPGDLVGNDRIMANWKWYFSVEEAHQVMAQACMQVLLFPECTSAVNVHLALQLDYYRDASEVHFKHRSAFLPYAAYYWADHYRDSGTVLNIAQRLLRRFPKTTDNFIRDMTRHWGIGLDTELTQYQRSEIVLETACEGGHEQVAKLLFQQLLAKKRRTRQDLLNISLAGACAGGQLKLVQTLLEEGADVDHHDGRVASSPLFRALAACRTIAARMHPSALADSRRDVMRLLLERGARVDASVLKGNERCPLVMAVMWQDLEVVEILLEQGGAQIDTREEHHGTALQAASRFGHEDIMRLLLERGADVNAQGGFYGSALQAACVDGVPEVVALLLEWDADVNILGGYYGTPLQAASALGRFEVVKLLLDWGADVSLRGSGCASALQLAMKRADNLDVVDLLIENGAVEDNKSKERQDVEGNEEVEEDGEDGEDDGWEDIEDDIT